MAGNSHKFTRSVVLHSVNATDSRQNLSLYCQPFQHLITSLVNSHLIEKVQTVLPCLSLSGTMAQDHVFRLICTLMTSRISAKVFTLEGSWSMLLKNVFASLCIKHEVLSELLTIFIANGLHRETKNEYNSVWKARPMTLITVGLLEQISFSCVALADYLNCLEDLNVSSLSSSSQQTDMILNQVQNIWSTVLTKSPGPLDFLVPRILDIYIYKNEFEEAIECLTTYKKLNRGNMNAYVYLFKFLVAYGDRKEEMGRTIDECFREIAQLSPSSPLIMEILRYCDIDPSHVCTILMEFIDYTSNKDNSDAWAELYKNLKKLDSEEMNTIRDHYQTIYSNYWPEYHWMVIKSEEPSELQTWKDKVKRILTEDSVLGKKNIRRSRSNSQSSSQLSTYSLRPKRSKITPKHELNFA